MSYEQNQTYWQARANQCSQFADEGACLARISRHVPVTIVPGLGQVDDATTLAARTAALVALQQALMAAGSLSIRTADGVISGESSPTLAAVRAAAQAIGVNPALVRRTASNGLTLPASLLSSLMAVGSGPATIGKPGAAQAQAPASVLIPSFATPTAAGLPSWLPWVAGGALVLGVIGIVARRR